MSDATTYVCGTRGSLVDPADCRECPRQAERGNCQHHPTPSELFDTLAERLRALEGRR